MATMSPEEVLLTTMQPTLRAFDNRAQGGVDFAKAQYLNAVQQGNSATDFARRAQEARALFALNAELQRETQKNIADRQDKQLEAYDERQEKSLRAQEDRAVAVEKARIAALNAEDKSRTIRELTTKYGMTVQRGGMSDDDYLTALLTAKANKDQQDSVSAATTILTLNSEIDRLVNPGSDPSKAAYVDSQMAVLVPGMFLRHLEDNNPTLHANIKKRMDAGFPLETAAVEFGASSLLDNVKQMVRGQIATGLATDEERIRLRQLGDTILQIQRDNPDVARKVGDLMAKQLLASPAKPQGKKRPPVDSGAADGASVIAPQFGVRPQPRVDIFDAAIQQAATPQAAGMRAMPQQGIAPVAQSPQGRTAFGTPAITSPEFWAGIPGALNRASAALVPSWSAFSAPVTNAPAALPAALAMPPEIGPRRAPIPLNAAQYQSFFAPTNAAPTVRELMLEEYRRRAALDPMLTRFPLGQDAGSW